jgi:hypothetical protein
LPKIFKIVRGLNCQEQVQKNYIEAENKRIIEDSKHSINRMKNSFPVNPVILSNIFIAVNYYQKFL